MSTIVPESTGSPLTGSWNVDPGGSTMNWPTRPWPQAWMPSTWSCQKMLSSWTSGYQRYWTNSTPAPSPAGCVVRRAVSRVTVAASCAVILWISMASVPSPTAMNSPSWNLAVLESATLCVPAAAGAVRVGSSIVCGRIDCSNDKPLMTPSDAWVSNCTWWMCMLTLVNGDSSVSRCSLVSVIATQSPMSPRMASGWAGLLPASTSALSLASTKILPSGSVAPAAVILIGS